MLAVKGGSYAIGSESTSLPFQDSDDILQPVNIFRYFLSASVCYSIIVRLPPVSGFHGFFRDLDNAYRITNTRWVKKIYMYRKRIIALSIVVVIGVNFAYNFADRRGVLHMGLDNPVEVTAHRGYSAVYPENTIPAFKGAIQVGADWAELDVQQTADGEVIVMHDSNLKRTTGLDKEVWQVTWMKSKTWIMQLV